MDTRFCNKTFVITGASSDVGLAFIRELGQVCIGVNDGPLLICHYHTNVDKLLKLAQNYPELKIQLVQADLSNMQEVDNLISNVSDRTEAPDYIIHLPARRFEYMRYKDMDMDLVQSEMAVQTYSFLRLTKPFVAKMKKIKGSRIVTMLTSYVADELPPQFMINYVTAKYALLGAMKAVAAEFGGKNLMCNGISPAMMDTKFLENIDPKIIEINKAATKNGELIKPEAIVPYIFDLIDLSCDKNGQNICVRN